MIATDRGLVLRSYPLRETSAVVGVLGRERGRVRLVAHGARAARSRFAVCLEPGNEIDLVYSLAPGRELGTLREASLQHAHLSGAPRLDVVGAGWAVLELLDRLVPEGAAEPQLTVAATDLLAALRRTRARAESVLLFYAFELTLLAELGLRPSLEACARCGRAAGESAGAVEIEAGAFRCSRCGGGSGPGRMAIGAPVGALLAALGTPEWMAIGLTAAARDRRTAGLCLHRLLSAHLERYRLPRALALLKKVDAPARRDARREPAPGTTPIS